MIVLFRERMRGGAKWLTGVSSAALALGFSASVAASTSTQATAEELAIKTVCTACHDLQLVLQRARTLNEWLILFDRMVDMGASGTDEDFRYVGRYITTRLTVIKVNEAPARYLAHLMDIPDSVAAAIVARRERQRFRDMSDLASVPGVDPVAIYNWSERIIF